jgi:hypothetical protein
MQLLQKATKWLAERPARRRQQALEKEMAELARRFNDLYCFNKQFVPNQERLTGSAMFGILPEGGNRWMCPVCNKIHAPLSCSVWSGLQYPACCKTWEGHRLDLGIRTPKN